MTQINSNRHPVQTPVLRRVARLMTWSVAALLIVIGMAWAADHKDQAVPVTFDGTVLFSVQAPLGPFSIKERAAAVERRLLLIAQDPFYDPDLFHVEQKGNAADVYYRDELVGVVTEADAVAAGTTAIDLASSKIQLICDALTDYRRRQLPEARMRAAVGVGIATVVLIGCLFGLRRFKKRLRENIQTQGSQRGLVFRMRQHLALPPEKIIRFGLQLLQLADGLMTLLLVVIYLEIVFGFMPMTRGYAFSVLDYLLMPIRTLHHQLMANIGDFFFMAVLSALTYFVLKVIRWLFAAASEGLIHLPGVEPDWAMPLYKIVRLVVLAIAAVMIYPYIPGSNTLAFKSIGLFSGALVTLGATGVSGNFIGGLMLIFMKAFHIGDRVQIGSVTGDILEANLVLTRLRTIKNEIISIPNAIVLTGPMTNYSAKAREEGLILHTSVTIGYDAPWRQVHELLIQAALKTPEILPTPAPFVLQNSLDDFFVQYQINAYTHQANIMQDIYGALHQNIQDAFNEAGVEIMSPHYTSLRDGNSISIPADNRGKNYVPPPFRVSIPKD